ncbi:PAN/Apple domain [Trinorchestia longiramus]|nr:PAN/Apple domain [Trinorchestia longiramus]
MKLLLLQLFTAALVPASAVYQKVIKDTAIHSPISKRIDVMTECECRAKCDMDSSCKAASYDAIADLCFMTDGGPDTVITQPLVGSVAFFKFQYVETPLEVFMAGATKNGSVARLMELCAEENGIPLIIKTKQAKDAALKLVKGECRTKCNMDSSCKAASYDAIANLCFMTDGGPSRILWSAASPSSSSTGATATPCSILSHITVEEARASPCAILSHITVEARTSPCAILSHITVEARTSPCAILSHITVEEARVSPCAILSHITVKEALALPCAILSHITGECRAKCDMDSSCKAASYDAVADLCFMTDSGQNTVITQPLVGSVAFFKFLYVETPLEMFMAEDTKNGSVARLRELCAKENGIPLIINTEQVKEAALKLVRGSSAQPTAPYEYNEAATFCVTDSLPSASKVNISTKNSHHLNNSTHSQQQRKQKPAILSTDRMDRRAQQSTEN